jgi:hypothetical protein
MSATSPTPDPRAAQVVRYWPTTEEPPRLPDGTVDVRALCKRWDDHCNGTGAS